MEKGSEIEKKFEKLNFIKTGNLIIQDKIKILLDSNKVSRTVVKNRFPFGIALSQYYT